MVATATASGKSLCYKIPAFENALERGEPGLVSLPDEGAGPGPAGEIRAFGLRGVHPATYDGDTPQAIRADVRRRANVVLTNLTCSTSASCPTTRPGQISCATCE